ncbi:ABC transporter substrate-binding protein, partial [Devosia sp.]|uniref:ABC transporter substrate-binding protein n=1 Tax=Devosia sp. TaxID=1871048 RepID=UPI001AC5130D
AANGDIDMQIMFLDTVSVRPVVVQNQEAGNYKLFVSQPAFSNAMLLNINQTHKDPVKRALFSNKDFRVGVSYAINREELNQLIYAGVAQPYQGAPRPGSQLYDEEMATQYTDFDLEKANAHLDAAGITARDAQGFRLDSEGRRVSFAVEVLTTETIKIDALERIKAYLAVVGVELVVRPGEQSLIFARLQSNDHDALAWQGGGGYDILGLLDPKWYLPHEFESSYASAWGIYYQNPNDPVAEEPVGPAKEQQDLYNQLKGTPDVESQIAIMKRILAITKEQFYVIGTNMEPDKVGIVKNNMHNVPALMPNTFFYLTPGPTNPEQYYFSN